MNQSEHRTEDLAFAAFLKVKGHELLRAEKVNPGDKRSKRIFIFKVPDGEIEGLRLSFVKSDFLKFYNEIISLKKL